MKRKNIKKFNIYLILTALILVIIAVFYLVFSSQEKFVYYPLKNSEDLNVLIDHASEKSYVLLGEASHGSSEYYIWRKKISQSLISENDFNFVLVEGDWDALYKINLYVKHLKSPEGGAKEIMKDFSRWPGWMWSNYEFLDFIEWLRDYNKNLDLNKKVGVYGMDVYGLSNSMKELIKYFENHDNLLAEDVAKKYNCLLKYEDDYSQYIQDLYDQKNNCQKEVLMVLEILENNKENSKEYFKAKQDALVVVYGEKHYRQNLHSGTNAWNARVVGMKDRLDNLINYYGKNSKAIIWAHNTHIGDARATSMYEAGRVNIGQLLREEHGNDNVYIVGFSSFGGTVMASLAWEEPARIFIIPKGKDGSLESYLAKKDLDNYYILLNNNNLPFYLSKKIGHRAKGVVYNPIYDNYNYVETIVKDRYDALIFFKNTSHLNPIK